LKLRTTSLLFSHRCFADTVDYVRVSLSSQ
jgi:hypothetical protein